MTPPSDPLYNAPRTVQDFIDARRRAGREMILARLAGRSTDLLSYEDVRAKLHAIESSGQVLREIPLDAVVGSVGRYSDFTRGFLPKRSADRQRWSRVKAIAEGLTGFPAIVVYQIGEAYFVRDGNHRVSVSKQSGATHIQAYVTQVRSSVPLESDVQPDDLILKAEYADFLEASGLATLRPTAEITLTAPGEYRRLLEHIEVHRYFMGLDLLRDIAYAEAVADWYDRIYIPLVHAIRACNILDDFPQRTEGDLYLWVSEHRHVLQERLDVSISTNEAARDLALRFSPKPRLRAARLAERIYDLITPDELEAGPRPGQWRRQRLAARGESDPVFAEILVPLGDDAERWESLEQALIIASLEAGHVHGLHINADQHPEEGQMTELRAAFLNRCAAAGLQGTFHYERGNIARSICYWSRWMDLVVLSLHHPTQSGPAHRFASGMRTILHRCPRPVLTVPALSAPLESMLLAYDGSPKAREALHLAALLNQRWKTPLRVLHVQQHHRPGEKILDGARGSCSRVMSTLNSS